jgi:hypothetical protein
MTDRFDQEVLRLAQVLSTVVRVSGRTRQSLEQQIGLSSGYLSKLLGGTVELRVRHILMVVEAIGMEPVDFFRLAFPRRPGTGGEKDDRRFIAEVQAALEGRQPEPKAGPDFDAQVKRSLSRLLGLGEPEPE